MSANKNDIFVSFSFKDIDKVKEIVKKLKEEYGINAWMYTNELRAGDKYFAIIPPAIRESGAFVFMCSKNSLASTEIPSEIEIAWKAKKGIIPFKIDSAEIEGSEVEYFLIPYNYIDGTVPDFKNRIDDLSQAIYSILSRSEDTSRLRITFREKLLSSKNILPTKSFVGREDIIQQIDEYFKNGHHVVFLSGIGGIGKTQIAKKYLDAHRQEYDSIIFATYEGDIKSLIIRDTPFVSDPAIVKKIKPNGETESDDEFFVRKLNKIKQLSNERTLIIIDNLDDEYRDEFKELFDGPYRLLITTRVNYSKTIYAQIDVNALQKDKELIDLFMNYYDGDLVERDDPHLLDLIKMVNCHTYTIELMANHMEMSCQTVDEMIEAFKNQNILSLNEKVMNSEMKTSIAYDNLLKLYNISSLNDEEINALRFLLFTPIEGLPYPYVKRWGGEEIFRTIKDLEKRSWVIKSSNGVALHPIVYQIAKNNIDVTFDTCKEFLNKYNSYIVTENSWNFKKTEKDIFGTFAYKFLEFFPDITEETEDLYYNIQCLFAFSVNPRHSAVLADKLYEYFKNKYGEENYYTARSAYEIGWLRIYCKELPNWLEIAKKWIIYSFELFQKIKLPNGWYEKAVYYNSARHISKTYLYLYLANNNKEDYNKALYYAKWALETLRNDSDEEAKKSRLPSMCIQVADVLLVNKEYEEALKYTLESKRLAGDFDDDLLYHNTREAKCLLGLGKFTEALELAKACVAGYIEADGKYHSSVLEAYEICRECYMALNSKEKIEECQSEIENIKKVLYSND